MCLLWRSPMTRSPESISGDFISKLAIADSGKLARQYHNWRLHEPPDFLPFCQPGALSTRLCCSRMPRHHTRPPGRYRDWEFSEFLARDLERISKRESVLVLVCYSKLGWRCYHSLGNMFYQLNQLTRFIQVRDFIFKDCTLIQLSDFLLLELMWTLFADQFT